MKVIYREEFDRWVPGDRYVRPLVRLLLGRKSPYLSGMQTVVRNFRLGLQRQGIAHSCNPPMFAVGRSAKVISFGLGMNGVRGLHRSVPVIAAIGFPYPGELPDLCREYNVKRYLQHSRWVLDLARSANVYDPQIFDLWPAGIDIDEWKPAGASRAKPVDVLIYDKILWNREQAGAQLVRPVREFLAKKGLSVAEVRYGGYTPDEYKRRLGECKVMVFLSAHESQGLAYQEALASDVPVIAWDPGMWLDPARLKIGRPHVPATSVPFFDERCGATFADATGFPDRFEAFFERHLAGGFAPREFILENLTIEKSTARMLQIYDSI